MTRESVVGVPPSSAFPSHKRVSTLRNRRRLQHNPGEHDGPSERTEEEALKGRTPGAGNSRSSINESNGNGSSTADQQQPLRYTRSRGWFRPPWRREPVPPPPPLPEPGADIVYAHNPLYMADPQAEQQQQQRRGFLRRRRAQQHAPPPPPPVGFEGIMGPSGEPSPSLPPRSETMENLMNAIAQQEEANARGEYAHAHPMDPESFVETHAPMAMEFTNNPSMPPPSPPIAGSLADGSFRVDNDEDEEIIQDLMMMSQGVSGDLTLSSTSLNNMVEVELPAQAPESSED